MSGIADPFVDGANGSRGIWTDLDNTVGRGFKGQIVKWTSKPVADPRDIDAVIEIEPIEV